MYQGLSTLASPQNPMFALVRHAGYHLGSGALTPDGSGQALALAEALKGIDGWKEIRVSPTTRTHETGHILAEALEIPMIEDVRVGMDGDLVDLLPPTEPNQIIFVSHLPVINRWLRSWSKEFNQSEPPLTEIGCGYLIDPESKTIKPLR
jgi:phosphohistidine phosphatase SixA